MFFLGKTLGSTICLPPSFLWKPDLSHPHPLSARKWGWGGAGTSESLIFAVSPLSFFFYPVKKQNVSPPPKRKKLSPRSPRLSAHLSPLRPPSHGRPGHGSAPRRSIPCPWCCRRRGSGSWPRSREVVFLLGVVRVDSSTRSSVSSTWPKHLDLNNFLETVRHVWFLDP